MHTSLPGADLLVRRKLGVPLVNLGIYVPRVEFEPPAQAGLGALTARSAVRGAGDLDAGALAFAFERLGGTLSRLRRVRLDSASAPPCWPSTWRRRRRCSTWCTRRPGWTSAMWSASAA